MPTLLFAVLAGTVALGPGAPPKRYIPPPLKVFIPYDAAWEGMHEALRSRELEVDRQDQGKGYIVSTFREYMSGPLTPRYLNKISDARPMTDGDVVKARYQYEILLEPVEEKEVLVTVYANIQALKRDFLGEQKWVDVSTLGRLEEELLTTFGKQLFGESFTADQPKVGFWERDPTYLPDLSEKIPRIARPERP